MKSSHILIGLIVVSVGLIGVTRITQNRAAADDPTIISTQGMHWHPHLSIVIRGEEIEIPPNIGLIGGHNPMHTHDTDGIVHLEYEAIVREDDIRLGTFFEIWNKPFSETQILEYQNTDTEKVRMYVNGEENFEFGKYLMQADDQIEIRYE